MKVTFYLRFYKKENSTATISSADETKSVQYDGVMVDGFDIMNPVISFPYASDRNIGPGYNYAYVETFKRYYFVDNWEYRDRLWYAHLKIDVLATWKNYIGAQSMYVLRSSASFDENIIDAFYPIKNSYTSISTSSAESDWATTGNPSDGCYVLGVINGTPTGGGFTSYYVLTANEMDTFRTYMMGSYTGSTIPELMNRVKTTAEDFYAEFMKSYLNPIQYITSCYWFPIQVKKSTNAVNINLGYWDTGISAHTIKALGEIQYFTFPRPSLTGLSNYRYYYPYAIYNLVMFPFGIIPINSMLIDENGLRVCRVTDYITGETTIVINNYKQNVSDNNSTSFITQTAQLGVPITVSSLSSNPLNMASAIGNGIDKVLGSPSVGNKIDGIGEILSSSISLAGSPSSSSTPTAGIAGSVLGGMNYLTARFYDIVEEDMEHNGRPLYKKRQLASLPGYQKVYNADLDIPCLLQEKQLITQYLEEGYYYE